MALAGVAQLVECCPVYHEVAGPILVQGICVAGLITSKGRAEGSQWMVLSHDVSFSPSSSSLPLKSIRTFFFQKETLSMKAHFLPNSSC